MFIFERNIQVSEINLKSVQDLKYTVVKNKSLLNASWITVQNQ